MPRIELSHGAFARLESGWLSAAEAGTLQSALTRELDWERRHIVLFGKRILQPRLIAWMGELPYRYSGQTLEPRPWPAGALPLSSTVSARVNDSAATAFNHVLVNRYRDGSDNMGYHSDAEPELGDDPVVACLSLGRTRRFVLKSRSEPKQPPHTLLLESGSLLVMGGTCQRHYRHALLRERDRAEAATGGVGGVGAAPLERISLTFRRVLRPPDQSRAPPCSARPSQRTTEAQ